jgi:hypothetical protein
MLVAGIRQLDGKGADFGLIQHGEYGFQGNVVGVGSLGITPADVQAHAVSRNIDRGKRMPNSWPGR